MPRLSEGRFASVDLVTDQMLYDQTGIRIAFTTRGGGVSQPPYSSLNLGSHVGDDPTAVMANRRTLCSALGVPDLAYVVPNQVHGSTLVDLTQEGFEQAACLAKAGCDGLVVHDADLGALLCFADCMPVIIVSPSGRFAVVHAGWRGCMQEIAAKAVAALERADRAQAGKASTAQASYTAWDYNIYLGPHIGPCCFETSEQIAQDFEDSFGADCRLDARHISLDQVQTTSLVRAGCNPDRIARVGECTVCSVDRYFSYRAESGLCGRHAALAFRRS